MSEDYQRIELITGTRRRRYWSTDEKLRIIEESLEPGETVSSVARRNGVAPNLLYRWRRLMNEGGVAAVGSDVRDMMLEAVEARFGTIRAPHPIEHLSDNGSPYTAKDTRNFAAALNLVPCFTPIRSPESNGISEAFVKTFKCDYVRISPLPDAPAALRQIAGWIEDYNEIHPHSSLRVRSPREFIRAQVQ
jgi:hypothetical protein